MLEISAEIFLKNCVKPKDIGIWSKQNESWLNEKVKFPSIKIDSQIEAPISVSARTKRGRPQKSFDDSCNRTKLRKTLELRNSSGTELAYAASVNLRLEGNSAGAKTIREVALSASQNIAI